MDNFYPTGHLWFLYYLIIFYALTLPLKRWLNKLRAASAVKCLSLGILLSCSCMHFMDRWIVDNPLTLAIEPPSFCHYYYFFLLGVLVSRQKELRHNINDRSGAFLCLAYGSTCPTSWVDVTQGCKTLSRIMSDYAFQANSTYKTALLIRRSN